MSRKYSNIYDYANFREYLRDYQVNRNKLEFFFTKSGICKKLGLPNTRSYFNDVLNGKTVTAGFVERFIPALELDPDETRYFRVLVQFNQSQNPQERDSLFEQLISLNKTPKKFLKPSQFAYYREWYHSGIRALLDVYDVKDDYKMLGKTLSPSVSAEKVKKSIQLLKELGLIKRNKKGFWKQRDKAVVVGPYVKDELVKQYQMTSLKLGINAILNPAPMQYSMSTLTLSLSKEIRAKIEKKIQNLKSEIRSMVHKDSNPAQGIYQLNLQFFPQSLWRDR